MVAASVKASMCNCVSVCVCMLVGLQRWVCVCVCVSREYKFAACFNPFLSTLNVNEMSRV